MLAVGILSLFLYISMHGYAPFGIRAAFLAEGVGSTLVITGGQHDAPHGSRSAFFTHAYGVRVIPVTGSMRKEGVLHYYTSTDGRIHAMYPAHSLAGKAYITLPVLGFLVRALAYPLGIMILIGGPSVAFVIDVLQYMVVQMRRKVGNGVGTRQRVHA